MAGATSDTRAARPQRPRPHAVGGSARSHAPWLTGSQPMRQSQSSAIRRLTLALGVEWPMFGERERVLGDSEGTVRSPVLVPFLIWST